MLYIIHHILYILLYISYILYYSIYHILYIHIHIHCEVILRVVCHTIGGLSIVFLWMPGNPLLVIGLHSTHGVPIELAGEPFTDKPSVAEMTKPSILPRGSVCSSMCCSYPYHINLYKMYIIYRIFIYLHMFPLNFWWFHPQKPCLFDPKVRMESTAEARARRKPPACKSARRCWRLSPPSGREKKNLGPQILDDFSQFSDC